MKGISGPCPPNYCLCPPNENCAPPPSEDCASKKVTGSVPLDCSLGPETPKLLFINPVFLSNNRFFADFAMKTCILFFGLHTKFVEFRAYSAMKTFFYGLHSQTRGKKFFVPPKNCMWPSSHAALAPGLQLLISYA